MRILLMLLLCLVSVQTRAQVVSPARPALPAYVAPPELPHTPTGAGASQDRLVGPEGASVQRSLNKRVLPPSNEPGVWAADGGPFYVVIGAAEVPYPAWVKSDADRETTRSCSEAMNKAFGDFGSESWKRVNRMSRSDQSCLAAKLLFTCADTRYARALNTRDPDWRLSQEAKDRVLGTKLHAASLAARLCRGEGSVSVQEVERWVLASWKSTESARRP